MDYPSILSWIQSGGVIAALVFTAYEVRARKRALNFRNYLDGIGGFIQDTKLLVENKDLQALYCYSLDDIDSTYEHLSEAQRSRVHYATQSWRGAKPSGLLRKSAG